MTVFYTGFGVSLELASVFVADEDGRMVKEAKVSSEPDVIIRELRSACPGAVQIDLGWPILART